MSDWFEHFGFAEVGDDLLMGAYPQDADDVTALRAAGVTAVFNLVQDVEYELPDGREACDGERVYVHCRAGMQRSAVVAAAVVALHEALEPLAALEQVRARNPRANPLAHQRNDLLRWWEARGG